MDDFSLNVARDREGRPGMKRSRLTIDIAHEKDEIHEERHEAAIKAALDHPGVIFLGGTSDGDPFDKPQEEER